MNHNIQEFLDSTTRTIAEEFIKKNCKTKADIIEFAKQTGTFYFSRGISKQKMISSIVNQTVGARLNHEAITSLSFR